MTTFGCHWKRKTNLVGTIEFAFCSSCNKPTLFRMLQHVVFNEEGAW